jgi:vacuolar protein sorting-associated protein IST1
LRILQQKKEAQAKASRRDIASLLERGKIETARVKVENIINEDIHVELLELLELYCELLLARFGLLDQNSREPDIGVNEGVCSIIHAAPRTELKELHVLREILMHKYGREFSAAVMENRDGCVSDRVVRKLNTDMPSADLVNAYLAEIAKAYSVDWSPPAYTDEDQGSNDGLEGGVKISLTSTFTKELQGKPQKSTLVDAKSDGGPTPKLPDIPPTAGEEEKEKAAKRKPVGNMTIEKVPRSPSPPEYDFEALTRRFEALKKR